MKSKANKGKGRFSFSSFSDIAKWTTVYKNNAELKKYEIILKNDKKEVVDCADPVVMSEGKTGTKVKFYHIHTLTVENMSFKILELVLLKEFSWFLYLYKNRDIKIFVNENLIDYRKYINTDLS